MGICGNGRAAASGRLALWSKLAAACCLLLFASGCFVSPNPISEEVQWERAVEDARAVFSGQDAPSGPVTLAEAVARAVKYNLDHRLSLMESALHFKQLDVANLGMLPRLAANAGYSWRGNESASSSMSYRKRTQSLESSFSQETARWTSDLSFSWTMLDFGLSYFQARQQADRFLILRERRRRIINNLVKDVIADYFRVVTAERIMPEAAETLARAEAALEVYQKMEEEKKGPMVQALEHQRSLVSIIGHLRQISMQMAQAKSRLAALMNLPLSADFEIAPPDGDHFEPPRLQADVEELELLGVYLRPDLREELYQARIDKYEAKKELLKMIPGLSVFSSLNYDTNKYLVHQAWSEAGLRTTLDIIGMTAKMKQYSAAKVQVEVARHRRLAATIAAMVQINMSYYQYRQALDQLGDADKLSDIDAKLLGVSRAALRAREIGALDQVRQAAIALNSKLERDRNLVEVLAAWSNLYFSIGGDILRDVHGGEDLPDLIRIAESALGDWLAGVVPALPEPPAVQTVDATPEPTDTTDTAKNNAPAPRAKKSKKTAKTDDAPALAAAPREFKEPARPGAEILMARPTARVRVHKTPDR